MCNTKMYLKHQVIINILYYAALRRSELINLKLEDISRDSKLNILNSKFGKSSTVPIPKKVLELINQYKEKCNPKTYLLNGDSGNLKYSGASIKNVIKNVYFANEIYNGENIKNSPDLFVVTEDGYILQEGFNSKLIDYFDKTKNYRSGEHRDNGILIIKGQNVNRNHNLDANLFDIFPTILSLLNIPIPEDIDGKLIPCFNCPRFKPRSARPVAAV